MSHRADLAVLGVSALLASLTALAGPANDAPAAASTATGTAGSPASDQASGPASGRVSGQLSDWITAADIQAQLDAGKVVIRSDLDASSHVSIDAAIRVHATPQQIWPLITRCDSAALMFPELKRCKELNRAPDGSWSIVEHDLKLSLLLPTVQSVFRNDYHPPDRLDFHRVAGNLKYEDGSYLLQPSADGRTTTIEYRMAMQPGFLVPHSIVRHSLKTRLPAALQALRTTAEHPGEASRLAASASSDDSTSEQPASGPDAPSTVQ